MKVVTKIRCANCRGPGRLSARLEKLVSIFATIESLLEADICIIKKMLLLREGSARVAKKVITIC